MCCEGPSRVWRQAGAKRERVPTAPREAEVARAPQLCKARQASRMFSSTPPPSSPASTTLHTIYGGCPTPCHTLPAPPDTPRVEMQPLPVSVRHTVLEDHRNIFRCANQLLQVSSQHRGPRRLCARSVSTSTAHSLSHPLANGLPCLDTAASSILRRTHKPALNPGRPPISRVRALSVVIHWYVLPCFRAKTGC